MKDIRLARFIENKQKADREWNDFYQRFLQTGKVNADEAVMRMYACNSADGALLSHGYKLT